jgi:hypothetical protein
MPVPAQEQTDPAQTAMQTLEFPYVTLRNRTGSTAPDDITPVLDRLAFPHWVVRLKY